MNRACSASAFVLFCCARVWAASYGDSEYGYWTADAFGNPAFVYVGGASSTPGAISPTDPVALHHVGNDRVSAIVFSDGSVTVRQDEGGAKVINGLGQDAQHYQFRAGTGYLSTASAVVAASAVRGSVSNSSCNLTLTLGVGSTTKLTTFTTPSASGSVSHTILAPFGDDSVLLSVASADVLGGGAPLLAWTEVWSSGDRWELGWGPGSMPVGWQANWSHTFLPLLHPGSGRVVGLVDVAAIADALPPRPRPPSVSPDLPVPSPHDPAPRPAFFVCLPCIAGTLALRSFTTCGRQVYCAGGADCTDASIDGPVTRQVGNIVAGLDNSTAVCTGKDAVLALQVSLPSLEGNTTAVAFVYGYLTQEDEDAAGGDVLAAVHAKVAAYASTWGAEPAVTASAWRAYANDLVFNSSAGGGGAPPTAALLSSAALRVAAAQAPRAYATHRVAAGGGAQSTRLHAPGTPSWSSWEGREAAWHSYMLRAGLSYDSYFGAHTLNQNGNYLFVTAQQAAARDPLAHVAGLAWAGRSAASHVLDVLNYTMREKRVDADAHGRPAGSITWGVTAYGMDSSGEFNQSDIELAFLMTLSQYVLGTRDVGALLNSSVPWNGTTASLGDAAWDSYVHLEAVISTGQHGLVRLLLSDHNDGLLGTLQSPMTPTIMEHGESVMNGGLAAYVLPLYAHVLTLTGGDDKRVARVQALADAQRSAVAAQWSTNGTVGWYRRVFLGNASAEWEGWRGDVNGDGTLWTETQSWAILGRVPDVTQGGVLPALVDTVDAMARRPSPIGAINAPPHALVDGGVGYTGVWYCGETALVTALGSRGYPDLALDEWRKSSLAGHAAAYPAIWFGVTSGPDVYNSVYAQPTSGSVPGGTRCAWNSPGNASSGPCNELAFPVLNMWSHTLGTYALPSLVGAEWDAGGMTLRPTLTTEDAYAVWTPLVSVSRAGGAGASTPTCAYSGHWAPFSALGSPVCITVELTPPDLAACTSLTLNGVPASFERKPGGLAFCGTLADAGALAGGGEVTAWLPAPAPVLLWQLA